MTKSYPPGLHRQPLRKPGRVWQIAVGVIAAVLAFGTVTTIKAHAATVVTMDGDTMLNSHVTGYCVDTPSVAYTTDGQPISVHLLPAPAFNVGSAPSTWWKTPPTADAAWQLSFRSLYWTQPLAYHAAYNDFPKNYDAIVNQVLAFYTQNPDPGTATTTDLTNANHWGWDEGTSLRRLNTLNCLYSLKADARIKAAMQKEVDVQVCPRYYGPPCHPAHNHAVMANTSIYHAGVLTGNDAWKTQSADRFASEITQFFDPNGFVYEQSSGYQSADINMWIGAANLIRADRPAQYTTMMGYINKATATSRWMTAPSNHRAQIGHGSDDAIGITSPTPTTAHWFVDDTVGWAIGRWSWTDPNSMFYIIRYGPPKQYHGTDDRPGVTWSDYGVPILVEPGTYGSDTTDPYVQYQKLPSSNNVVITNSTQTNVAVKRQANTNYSTSHAYTFTDLLWPNRAHSRYYAFYGAGSVQHKLLVRDTVANDPDLSQSSNGISQRWHLDPTWSLKSQTATGAVFTSAGGRTLTLTTTGSSISVVKGLASSTAPKGWHFPSHAVKKASVEITVSRSGQGTTGNTVVESDFIIS